MSEEYKIEELRILKACEAFSNGESKNISELSQKYSLKCLICVSISVSQEETHVQHGKQQIYD
jgi:hypothetical protein